MKLEYFIVVVTEVLGSDSGAPDFGLSLLIGFEVLVFTTMPGSRT